MAQSKGVMLNKLKQKKTLGFYGLLFFITILYDLTLKSQSSIVVNSYHQYANIDYPWKNNNIQQSKNMGFVVTPEAVKDYQHFFGSSSQKKASVKYILTTSSAVKDIVAVDVQKTAFPKKYHAKVVFVDWEVDLALLEVQDKSLFDQLKPISFTEDLSLRDNLSVHSLKVNNNLEINLARFSKIEVKSTRYSSYPLTIFHFKTQKNGLGRGEGIFKGKSLAGLSYSQDSQYLYVTPAFVIKKFLADYHKNGSSYSGFPWLGIETQKLTNPILRQSLKLTTPHVGVFISRVDPNSPFYNIIKPHDVLLSIAGENIRSDQTIENHTYKQRLSYHSMLNHLGTGQDLTLVFSSSGKIKKASKKLNRYDSNRGAIRFYREGRREEFLVYGGIIFQTLSLDYLKTWGSLWFKNAPTHFLYFWKYKNFFSSQKKIVFIPRVFPDKFNKGFEKFSNKIVKKVNDKDIYDLNSLRKALLNPVENQDGDLFTVINLAYGGGKIVLDHKLLRQAAQRISKNYSMKEFYDSHFIKN